MRVKIYQINPDRDADGVKFFGTGSRENLHRNQTVDPSVYGVTEEGGN